MSTHIGAAPGEIAPYVLLPGDPLRARWIAETRLTEPRCVNEVRGMLGYTGTYAGTPVTVHGTGMGMPSLAIYAHELFTEYGVQVVVRVGSCGALVPSVRLREVVLAMSAATDSAMNQHRFRGVSYAPTADFGLLQAAHRAAVERGVPVHVGPVASWDAFYPADPTLLTQLAGHGVLAVEMETAALYTVAAGHGRRALAVCTVSDSLVTGEQTDAAERERGFATMVELALDVVVAAARGDRTEGGRQPE